MTVQRSKKVTGSSSSSSSNSTDVSDPSSLDGSKRLRSWAVPPRKRKCTHEIVRPYATDAINVYNEQTGEKYELVQPGFMEFIYLEPFTLHHIDFTAKKTEVADAPEELFSAELTTDDKGGSFVYRNGIPGVATGEKYKLVQPGFLEHHILPQLFLHHTDFTAKKTEVDDAPQELFFAELKTDNMGLSVNFCKRIGPKESISGDKNNGCRYCSTYSVQHPRGGGFRAGGAGLFRDRSIRLRRVGPVRKECEYTSGKYATEALSFHNKKTGKKYELVQPGFMEFIHLEWNLEPFTLRHINFTAKKTEVADAPEELFFAELTIDDKGCSVKSCQCIKESISGDKHNGCCYCTSYSVQHPRAGGFMAGRAGLFPDENLI